MQLMTLIIHTIISCIGCISGIIAIEITINPLLLILLFLDCCRTLKTRIKTGPTRIPGQILCIIILTIGIGIGTGIGIIIKII